MAGVETFAKRLFKLRNDLDISQTDLTKQMEEQCGVSVGPNYISRLEKNKTRIRPSLDVLRALAVVLRTNIDYLAGLTDDASPSSQREDLVVNYLSPEADEVAQMLDKLPAERRAEIRNIVHALTVGVSANAQGRAELQDFFGLVERNYGRETRQDVEQVLRRKAMPTQ